jgi:oxygen-independent coproporphyrinogen-3 oxidase
LEDFFNFLHKNYQISKETEITFESNPYFLNQVYLKNLKELGVNRLSCGVQSFEKRLCKKLKRPFISYKKINQLLEKNQINTNLDFIFAIPSQNTIDLTKDLKKIIKLPITHLSYYALDLSKTNFIQRKIKEKDILKKYEFINNFLDKNNFFNYEFYNFAKNKSYCKHNYNFWQGEDYLGFGLGASSYYQKVFRKNTYNLKDYFNNLNFSNYKFNKTEDQIFLLTRKLRLNESLKLNKLLKKLSLIIPQDYYQIKKGFFKLSLTGKMNFNFIEKIIKNYL